MIKLEQVFDPFKDQTASTSSLSKIDYIEKLRAWSLFSCEDNLFVWFEFSILLISLGGSYTTKRPCYYHWFLKLDGCPLLCGGSFVENSPSNKRQEKKGFFLKIIGVELVTPCSEFILAEMGLMLDVSKHRRFKTWLIEPKKFAFSKICL